MECAWWRLPGKLEWALTWWADDKPKLRTQRWEPSLSSLSSHERISVGWDKYLHLNLGLILINNRIRINLEVWLMLPFEGYLEIFCCLRWRINLAMLTSEPHFKTSRTPPENSIQGRMPEEYGSFLRKAGRSQLFCTVKHLVPEGKFSSAQCKLKLLQSIRKGRSFPMLKSLCKQEVNMLWTYTKACFKYVCIH